MNSKIINVLNKGEIELVDILGNDLRIVESARVTVGQGLKDDIRDKKLIDYLLRNDHGSPFEMVSITLRVKCPIFVMRQWIRHRIASYNEISARYSVLTDDMYFPNEYRCQSKSNKQGSSDDKLTEEKEIYFNKEIKNLYENIYKLYEEMIDNGIARELARIVLPVATYTEFYWKINIRSLMNFLKLRLDEHAQWEIRQYAIKINEIFQEHFPWTAEAFEKRILNKKEI